MGKAIARTMCACCNVCRHSPVYVSHTLAEKSAAAVADMAASADSRACQTAPLWPRNVPILDGVQIGGNEGRDMLRKSNV